MPITEEMIPLIPPSEEHPRRQYTNRIRNALIGMPTAEESAAVLQTASQYQYVSAATSAATARFMAKLHGQNSDAVLLYVSDSTGNADNEHVFLEVMALAAAYPHISVSYRQWNVPAAPNEATGTAYDSPRTLQTGSGSHTLTVYNVAMPGGQPAHMLGSKWTAAFEAITPPDLTIISHGHNMGDPVANSNGHDPVRWKYLEFTEELAQLHPQSGIVLTSQNPTFVSGRLTWQEKKARICQQIAAQRGFGFIDVHQAFVDTGNAAAYVLVDQVHPTTSGATNGSQLWADVVGEALTYSPTAASLPQQPSPLTTLGKSLIANGYFTDWTGSEPAGWTVVNGALSKDTTNYETGTYGMAVTGSGSSGAAYAQLTGSPTSLGIKGLVSNRVITAAARVYVPSAMVSALPSLQLVDQTGGAAASRGDVYTITRNRFCWLVVTRRFVGPTTTFTIRLHSRVSGTDATPVTFDRLFVVEGDLPRGIFA